MSDYCNRPQNCCRPPCPPPCPPACCCPGPTGPQGRRGPIGPTGPTGAAGNADTIIINQTLTGEPGTQAQVIDRTYRPRWPSGPRREYRSHRCAG